MAFNWTCPYCDRAQSVVDSHYEVSLDFMKFSTGVDGRLATRTISLLCANEGCQRTTVSLIILPAQVAQGGGLYVSPAAVPRFAERVLPRGASKPQPDYIPNALVQDYNEACLIKDASPKASATLARRCLQGMIRHFTGISKRTLLEEINSLRAAVLDGSAPRAVTVESVEAINHVRGVGNIGAHMERDIDVIVEVDPDEAGILIGLIEMLFKEWYVEQRAREERLAAVTALGVSKEQEKLEARAARALLEAPRED